jgi:hypothetical protein
VLHNITYVVRAHVAPSAQRLDKDADVEGFAGSPTGVRGIARFGEPRPGHQLPRAHRIVAKPIFGGLHARLTGAFDGAMIRAVPAGTPRRAWAIRAVPARENAPQRGITSTKRAETPLIVPIVLSSGADR